MRSGDYSLAARMLPIFSVIGVAGHISFYFILSALGFKESAMIRFGTAAFIAPALFMKPIRKIRVWQIVYWESAIALGMPFAFTWLFLLNDMSTYWWTSLLFAGVFYGLLSGRFFFSVTVFPAAVAVAGLLFCQLHSMSLEYFFDGIAAYIIACFSAVCAGGARLGGDLFYRILADYESMRVKAESMEALKKVAEEKLRVEQELRQMQKLEAIGRLAGGVAHDFNNQLVAISISADMLKRKLIDPEDLELIDCIVKASSRSSSLTRQLLAFSRGSNEPFGQIDMHELITETVSLLSRGIDKRIALETRLHAEKSVVGGDAGLMQNALLNLGLNAAQAMPAGGSLILETSSWYGKPRCPGEKRCKISEPDEGFQLSVSDTGYGMDEQVARKAFEPFFTTKKVGEGVGMGLSVVYGTVKSHGGCICCKSEPAHGTRIYICLPFSNIVAGEDQPDTAPVNGAGTVMLIDDEELVRTSLTRLLILLGYTVVSFGGGREALDYFVDNSDSVDLVLLDMVMPDMAGPEVFDRLRKIDPDAAIIILSGYAAKGSVDSLIARGACAFINKPVKTEEFARIIKSILSEQASR